MRYFLIILFLIAARASFAEFYIVNKDNEVIGVAQYEPSKKDLDTRQEISVFSSDKIDLSKSEYRSGKIVEHVKTKAELKEEKDISDNVKKESDLKIVIANKLKALNFTDDEIKLLIK